MSAVLPVFSGGGETASIGPWLPHRNGNGDWTIRMASQAFVHCPRCAASSVIRRLA